MNKSQELITQLKQSEANEIVNYKKTIHKLVMPLNNQLFFSAKTVYEYHDEQPRFIFTIKLLEAKENTLDFLTHTVQISLNASKTDKQDNSIKVIKANELKLHYSNATIEASDILDFLGGNVYFNCNSSSYSDVSQIISNIFDYLPNDKTLDNWILVGKTRESLGGGKTSQEVYLHHSLVYKQFIPISLKQLEMERSKSNQADGLKLMENKLQNDFLQMNLSVSENKPKKPKI